MPGQLTCPAARFSTRDRAARAFCGLGDRFDPPDDARRWHRFRANPGIQLTGSDENVIAERLAAITRLAERLDRWTLDLAVRLVPHESWAGHLSPRPPEPGPDQPAGFRPA